MFRFSPEVVRGLIRKGIFELSASEDNTGFHKGLLTIISPKPPLPKSGDSRCGRRSPLQACPRE